MTDVPPQPSGATANLATATTPQGPAAPGVSYPLPPFAIPPAPAPQPTLARSWPQPAQGALAVLLLLASALLAVNAWGHLRSGTEPGALTYRVDLNRASRAELMQLPGVGPKLAERIEEFRTENEGFERVEDLLYVQGVGPATLERLRPHVVVAGPWQEPTVKAAARRPAPSQAPVTAPPIKKSKKELALQGVVIDVNAAPQSELQRLPGIGPKLSQRIMDERAKGRFAKVDDLRRVHGIGPKTLERLRPYVTVGKAVQLAER